MRFFFFGSLLDADVAELVLGRRPAPRAWEPAALDGYVRAIFAKESYPILVPRAGGRVDGALMRGLSAEDTSRIAWFEEGEYDVRALPVTLDMTRPTQVQALAQPLGAGVGRGGPFGIWLQPRLTLGALFADDAADLLAELTGEAKVQTA